MGLEHWHGSKVNHTNSCEFAFTPENIRNGKYEFTIELSVNGRGERMYVPFALFADNSQK